MLKLLLCLLLSIPLTLDIAIASLQVDRSVQQGDWAKILVTYTNDSPQTYSDGVVLQCIAYIGKAKVAMGEDHIYTSSFGPITPGFSRTVEVLFRLHGSTFDTVSCNESPK